jgi:hypothetical protein
LSIAHLSIRSDCWLKAGIDILKFTLLAVDKKGKRLSLPPIHMHHIHVAPPNGVRLRLSPMPMCPTHSGLGIGWLDEWVSKVGRDGCYNSTLVMEQHGDYVCQPEDDGVDCLTQGAHLPRRVIEKLDIEGELNDVRPAGSEPMEWYFQIAMRWAPVAPERKYVDLMALLGNIRIVPTDQGTLAGVMPTPTDEPTFTSVTGQMLNTGEMVRGKVHSHSAIYESSFLFAAEYADVGLDASKFVPNRSWQPRRIQSELGFRDSKDLVEHMLSNLEKSQAAWDARCADKDPAKARLDPYSICKRPRPEWICGAKVDEVMVEFDGAKYPFDRRPKTFCKPWSFQKGDSLVYAMINKAVEAPIRPHEPGVIPPVVGNHLALLMYYISNERPYSYSNGVLFSHFGVSYDNVNSVNPMEWVARVISVASLEGFPVYPGTLVTIQYTFVLVVTALLGALGYGGFFLFDRFVKPRLLVASGKARKPEYELVKLMDHDDDVSGVDGAEEDGAAKLA